MNKKTENYNHYGNEMQDKTGRALNMHGVNHSLVGEAQEKVLGKIILKWVLQKMWNVMTGFCGEPHDSVRTTIKCNMYCTRPILWHPYLTAHSEPEALLLPG
jgi:hypothetical protein